ncbi:MAG: alpha-glucan family phosphorylase [Solirubrobacteraceae bacterium]
MATEAAHVNDGSKDIAQAAADLAERLPDELAPLAELAYNYRWSWLPGGPELFRSIDPGRFYACYGNPVRLLQEVSSRALRGAAADSRVVQGAADLLASVNADLERPFVSGPLDPAHPAAFLCAEYGVHASLPIYSGGLGALAGDFVKEASDRALPFVAVGLMYRQGYFRQRIDSSGWQHEYWVDTDPERLPAALVTNAENVPLTISVPVGEHEVTARIWRVSVGRVPLLLLDTECPENEDQECWITSRLYVSDPDLRLAQYTLLGAGGVRALRAVGIEPGLIHLNEGHAALAPLELARPQAISGVRFGDALVAVRGRTVFTTHTPVPAGNDAYPAEQVREALTGLAAELGIEPEDLLTLGRTNPADLQEPFGVTQAALRMSAAANGVSRRHGEVARTMWHGLWPEREPQDVPIGHVTNGVHVPSWVGPAMRTMLERALGEDWCSEVADSETWTRLDDVTDEELWAVRRRQRAELIDYLRRRSVNDRLARGDLKDYVGAAARVLDPEALTIGFARRVATYKRLDLLTRDPEWTLALLGGDRPVQAVLAGKAHPRDEEAKRVLQSLFGLKHARIIGERVVFLEDYDLASASWLVRGCDVWLNLPRPPLEASGTSGMKSAINGGLQFSVLDGWWAEAYDGENGWALSGDVNDDPQAQDAADAAELHRVLDDEIFPAFYERDGRDLPDRWLARMRASLKTLGPRFSATRMLNEYVNGPYTRVLAESGR